MTMIDIDMRLLRTFLSVAAERNFSRAADRLSCSQATISLRVQALESLLNRKLFNRGYHSVELSLAGRDLLPQAQALLDHHDSLLDRVQRGKVSGQVRLGVAEDYAQPTVSRLMRGLAQSYPDIELSITCMLSAKLGNLVDARGLDLAIVTLPREKARSTIIRRPRLVWISAEDFAAPINRPWPIAFYNDGCVFRATAERALKENDVGYRIVLTSDSGEAIKSAVSSGTAISVMAEGMVPQGYVTVPADAGLPELPTATIQLIEREDGLSKAAEQVKSLLVNFLTVS